MSETAVAKNLEKKAIVFTDWDGTVTLQDSNDFMTDTLGYGVERRRFLNLECLEGRWTFRDAFKDMLDSINVPFDECIEILKKNISLDPGFKTFYEYCRENDIPVIVVSSGMEPVIRALLTELVGEEASKEIEIISNQVKISEDKSWDIVYRDETSFGHDKSRAIKPYNGKPRGERPLLFYCGDGVSDLSAARETDLLFAKEGRDLVTYCEREKVPYTLFNSFADILEKMKKVISGGAEIDELVENKQ